MSVQSITLEVPKVKKRRWGKPKPGESLKMLAAGSLAFAKAYSSVEKLEDELEAEIQRDKDRDPKRGKGIHKWRRKGGKFLLSKFVLLFIVVINIIDCCLVLGELILDLHHVKDILSESEESTSNFLHQLHLRYPKQFNTSNRERAYEHVLNSQMFWFQQPNDVALIGNKNGTTFYVPLNTSASIIDHEELYIEDNGHNSSGILNNFSKANRVVHNVQTEASDASPRGTSVRRSDKSVWSIVGYVFHKTSLTISCILVLWVLLKAVCFGRHLLDRKLEIFDTFIIMTSFTVDMIFVKGLSMYSLQDFVFILAFMLPWRVIRVTNSLVVAVKDHEHFRLKMLYTQKKKIESDNKQIRAEKENYREQIESLKKLCLAEGIDDWKIFQSLGKIKNGGHNYSVDSDPGITTKQPIRPGGKGAMGSFASLAFGAIGSKSSSFWSVLGTPRMRRGKSEELMDKKIVSPDTSTPPGQRHKGRILSFLGSSSDFFKGKIKNGGHNYSVDSDPGITSTFIKHNNPHQQQNGHVCKRLVRGETIDTVSTDSLDVEKNACQNLIDDSSRQATIDSNVFETNEKGCFFDNSKSMQKASSEESARPPFYHSSCIIEESPILLKPRSASMNEGTRNHLDIPGTNFNIIADI